MLTRSQILDVDDLPRETVDVPEWGGSVTVRALTGSERDAFEAALYRDPARPNLDNVRARLCAMTILGEDGTRLFTDADVPQLGAKSARALDRVFPVAQRLSGLRKEDVEDLVKNSLGGRVDDSPSA